MNSFGLNVEASRLRISNSHQLTLWGTLLPFLAWKRQDSARISIKKATFEEINFRKKTFGGIYLYKTWTARFIIQCSRVLGFFQILQDSVTYFVYFCQFGNFLLISSCCFEENFWLFHARNDGHVPHIFCCACFQAPSLRQSTAYDFTVFERRSTQVKLIHYTFTIIFLTSTLIFGIVTGKAIINHLYYVDKRDKSKCNLQPLSPTQTKQFKI